MTSRVYATVDLFEKNDAEYIVSAQIRGCNANYDEIAHEAWPSGSFGGAYRASALDEDLASAHRQELARACKGWSYRRSAAEARQKESSD